MDGSTTARDGAAAIAGVHLWWWTARGRAIGWEGGADALLGGPPPGGLAALLDRLDPASRAAARRAGRQALRSGAAFDLELRMAGPEGRWLRVIGRPEPSGGRPLRVVGTVQDTDRHKRADIEQLRRCARFEAIFDSVDAVVFIKNRDGVLLAANRKYREGAGREDVVGRTDHDLYPPAVADGLRARDVEIFRSGLPFTGEEHVTLASGASVVYLSSKFLIADAAEGDMVLCGIATDITAERRLQAELEASRKAAEAANEAKSQFLATMSHELRTPMNGALGMLSLLLASPLEPRQRWQAEVAQRSAAQLLEILDSILDFSRLEAGAALFETAPFDLAGVLREAAALFSGKAETKGLALSVEISPDLPARILGDGARVRQVALNLIGNAVKFTVEGSIAIRAWPLAGGGAAFAVRDTGIGIAPEAQARVFDRFAQADASTTRRFGGTGLGLAISRQLVEGMGGRILLDSAPGAGSVFRVELPGASAATGPALVARA